MKRFNYILVALAFGVAGCSTEKVLEATGGSRADAVVNLSFEYSLFEVPHVNMEQARSTARSRCAVWGYVNAEPFGASVKRCVQADVYGDCLRTQVTVAYQCTGSPAGR